jgi:hypothetical protein
MVYTAMYYDYEQTDLMMASDNLEEIKEHDEKGCVISVWDNGIQVDVHYNKEEGKWKTDWKESVLDKEELDLFKRFLEINNLK